MLPLQQQGISQQGHIKSAIHRTRHIADHTLREDIEAQWPWGIGIVKAILHCIDQQGNAELEVLLELTGYSTALLIRCGLLDADDPSTAIGTAAGDRPFVMSMGLLGVYSQEGYLGTELCCERVECRHQGSEWRS